MLVEICACLALWAENACTFLEHDGGIIANILFSIFSFIQTLLCALFRLLLISFSKGEQAQNGLRAEAGAVGLIQGGGIGIGRNTDVLTLTSLVVAVLSGAALLFMDGPHKAALSVAGGAGDNA